MNIYVIVVNSKIEKLINLNSSTDYLIKIWWQFKSVYVLSQVIWHLGEEDVRSPLCIDWVWTGRPAERRAHLVTPPPPVLSPQYRDFELLLYTSAWIFSTIMHWSFNCIKSDYKLRGLSSWNIFRVWNCLR